MNLQKQRKLLQKEINKDILSSLLQKNISVSRIYKKKQMNNKKLLINQRLKTQRLKTQQSKIQQIQKQQIQKQRLLKRRLQIQRFLQFQRLRNQWLKVQQFRRKQIQPQKNIDLETYLKINRNVKKIVSCYTDPPQQGLGDFIRGTCYLFHLCDKYNKNYDIIISNVINNFLRNNNNIYKNINSVVIPQDGTINKDIINKMKHNNILKIYTNHMYNKEFLQKYKNVIKNALEPSNEINNTVDNILQSIDYKKKEYIIVHIRTGDTAHNNIDRTQCNLKTLNNIYNKLNFYEEYFKTNNVFVISDSTSVKTALKEKYNFECCLNKISHFSDKTANIDAHKNTFIDFVLMSESKQIISLSVHNHYKGSGFSYWASALYNIPYNFLQI